MHILSWMPWYFLPMIAVGIALPLYLVVKLLRGSAERNRILSTGTPAQATISRIWETGTRVNDRPMVGFELQVWPPGGQPYPAQCSMIVSPLAIPRIQPGATVAVKIDRADASKVAIVL